MGRLTNGSARLIPSLLSLFPNRSMQSKLVVVFVVLIIVPMITANYVAYLHYRNYVLKNTTEYTTEISGKMLNKLEDYIDDMKRLTVSTQYSKDLLQYMDMQERTVQKYQNIDSVIQLLNNMKKETHTIYIFDRFGNVFYNYKTEGVRSDIMQYYEPWRKIAAEADGKPVLIRPQAYMSRDQQNYYIFSIIKEIKDLLLQPIGFVVVDANIKVIEDAVVDLDNVTKGDTLIVDETNHVVYDSAKSRIGTDAADLDVVLAAADADTGRIRIERDGVAYICTYKTSSKLGWKAFVFVPLHELQKGIVATRNFTIAATSAIFVMALLLSFVPSYTLTRPLRRLTLLMKQVQGGNLDVKFNIRYQDEIGLLGRNFNIMLERIKRLIEEVSVMQSRKNRAEMDALQSQIRPHFIYNTLESIRMTAYMHNDAEVSNMIYILSKSLRYSVNRGDETVTLQDELEHLDDYMLLQNYRFGDQYVLHVELDEAIRRYPIIKLALQPIVENVIFHSREDREEGVRIDIYAVSDDRYLRIVIADDGIGMADGKLEKLAAFINSDQPGTSQSSIGLRNVNFRLKHRFGEQYGLLIESEPGRGTSVTLLLPPLER